MIFCARSHYERGSQAIQELRTYDAVIARTEHCDTSEAAHLFFYETNSSFNYRGLCVLMHTNPRANIV